MIEKVIAVVREVVGAHQAFDGVRRTGLLTDNPPILKEALAHELQTVGSRFEFLVFSSALRSLKPTAQFFHAALAEVRRSPEEVMLIDDGQANVAAAAGLGMAAVGFTTATALRADLVRAGLLPDAGAG